MPQTAKTIKGKARVADESDDDILVDTTQVLSLRSKKTDRLKRKLNRKSTREAAKPHLISLLPEILLEILFHLRPSEINHFRQTCTAADSLVRHHDAYIAKTVISCRYSVLAQCFPRPVLLEHVDSSYHELLLATTRQNMLAIHRKPYAHVPSHDPSLLCSCLTCVLAWNNLCLLVDLWHWTTTAIARRQPIPMMPRGQNPEWNQKLTEKHAAIVRRALTSPLSYALILERHLETTVFGIRRYASDKDTMSFGLTDNDVASGTDGFCARKGPPSYEFPIHRDAYYGLQTYLPNRLWKKSEGRWRYQPADQHVADLQWVRDMANKAKQKDEQGRPV